MRLNLEKNLNSRPEQIAEGQGHDYRAESKALDVWKIHNDEDQTGDHFASSLRVFRQNDKGRAATPQSLYPDPPNELALTAFGTRVSTLVSRAHRAILDQRFGDARDLLVAAGEMPAPPNTPEWLLATIDASRFRLFQEDPGSSGLQSTLTKLLEIPPRELVVRLLNFALTRTCQLADEILKPSPDRCAELKHALNSVSNAIRLGQRPPIIDLIPQEYLVMPDPLGPKALGVISLMAARHFGRECKLDVKTVLNRIVTSMADVRCLREVFHHTSS